MTVIKIIGWSYWLSAPSISSLRLQNVCRKMRVDAGLPGVQESGMLEVPAEVNFNLVSMLLEWFPLRIQFRWRGGELTQKYNNELPPLTMQVPVYLALCLHISATNRHNSFVSRREQNLNIKVKKLVVETPRCWWKLSSTATSFDLVLLKLNCPKKHDMTWNRRSHDQATLSENGVLRLFFTCYQKVLYVSRWNTCKLLMYFLEIFYPSL